MAAEPDDVAPTKRELRAAAFARRRRQPHKDRLSRRICERLVELPEYARAKAVLFYVDARSEVRTRRLLPIARQQGKRTVVPYCVGNRLELFLLKDADELAVGTIGILEPKMELRGNAERKIEPAELDLVVVPGVAFDRTGGRLGHGKGYYDRFLRTVRSDATLVGLAFECQLFPSIPMRDHDVAVHKVITEKSVYQ